MSDNEKTSSSASSASAGGQGRGAARRKPAAPRRRSPRRKPARSRSRDTGSLRALLTGLSRQAARAGKQIASASQEGVSSARRTLGKAESVSKRAIGRLTQEWKRMDNRRRAQFVAALLGALAAASAPLVRSRLKRK